MTVTATVKKVVTDYPYAAIGAGASPAPDPTADWDADAFRARVPGPHFEPALAGRVLHSSADVVSSEPELARL